MPQPLPTNPEQQATRRLVTINIPDRLVFLLLSGFGYSLHRLTMRFIAKAGQKQTSDAGQVHLS